MLHMHPVVRTRIAIVAASASHDIGSTRQSFPRRPRFVYRNCIFCSADLGTNNAIESFPVGRAIAFDSRRGRLWAVCAACGRWNLSPVEERWEPVETAEKLFRDARLRVQSENVGLATLPEGTSLIRVGEAVAGEMAAWRYGRQLLQRRRRYLFGGGLATVGAYAIGGFAVLGGSAALWGVAAGVLQTWHNRKIVHRLPQQLSGDGADLLQRGERTPRHGRRARCTRGGVAGGRRNRRHRRPTPFRPRLRRLFTS